MVTDVIKSRWGPPVSKVVSMYCRIFLL